MKIETIDSSGKRDLLKKKFVGLWSPGEDVTVPRPYHVEKTVITVAVDRHSHVFALYELPENGSGKPVIPERQ